MKKPLLTLLALSVTYTGVLHAETANYISTKQYGSVFFRVMQQQYLYLVGRFDDYSAQLELDPNNLSATKLTAKVEMGSLNLADSDVSETLISSSAWFNSSLFPIATFTSDSAKVLSENKVILEGELNFLGISKLWQLEVEFLGGSDGNLEGSSIGMHATGMINRLDFGMDQYRNVAADEVGIEVNVKFNRN
jgi:polyisoprenoid-binding protein YceI